MGYNCKKVSLGCVSSKILFIRITAPEIVKKKCDPRTESVAQGEVQSLTKTYIGKMF